MPQINFRLKHLKLYMFTATVYSYTLVVEQTIRKALVRKEMSILRQSIL